MNIRTSLQVSAVFPIVLAIMVSISLFIRARHVGRADDDLRRTMELSALASDLHASTVALAARGDSESRQLWETRCSSLRGAIEGMNVESSLAARIVKDRILGLMDRMKESLAEGEGASRLSAAVGNELVSESGTILRNVFELGRILGDESSQLQERADLVFAIFIGVMGLVMAGATLSLSNDLVRRIVLVNRWAQSVADGHLETKIETFGRNDEVGQLARSFADMTRKLGAAYAAMEKEIQEHKRVADALRESNVLLSGALEKLKRAQAQIIQQERLHVLEQIVRGIAHEFNNTLTPILGMSDLLLAYPDNMAKTDMVRENLKAINEAARKAREDVRKLSAFFRPHPRDGVHAVEINEVVARAIDITRPRWRNVAEADRAAITISTSLAPVPPVRGEAEDLQECFVGLIMNAVEAMPNGGKLSIATRLGDNNTVTIEIQDTGEGMSEEVLARCLEPFFSTKGLEGTGMGLTIANTVVRGYGGVLDVKSLKGKGTTVTITLPVWNSGVEDRSAEPITPVTKKLSVLVADDESWTLDVVSRILTAEGHRVDTADNGTDGLRKARAGTYDVVITDRAMPDMVGDDLAATIKTLRPGTAVILLTGFGDIMLAQKRLPAGVDMILSKPLTAEDLVLALSKVASKASA